MIIIGAGMAGLLAGRMLGHRSPTILEAQASLPNNHSAVLRFRDDTIGSIVGVQFKKVQVLKDTLADRDNIIDASLRYSRKCTGVYRSDRSVPLGPERSTRFIAPTNMIEMMARGLDIKYERLFTGHARPLFGLGTECEPTISTMPMPSLMKLLDYDGQRPAFRFTNGFNIRTRVPNCEAYATLYDARRGSPSSRISITGDELIIEVPNPESEAVDQLNNAKFLREFTIECAQSIGITLNARIRTEDIELIQQKYAKILPIDDDERHRFIHWATDKHNVYSLGRYATWRPGLLMDDLVQDIKLIDKFSSKGRYHAVKAR